MNRREMLAAGAVAGLAVAATAAEADRAAALTRLRAANDTLRGYLRDLLTKTKHRLPNGVAVQLPSTGGYVGVWPDDCFYPLMAAPDLVDRAETAGLIGFLTDSCVGLGRVPDRVEPDGLPVLSPGATNNPPMTDRIPLHLPAAWVRLLDYAEAFGVTIPRKGDWARLIERSFDQVPLSCGLAYADPQHPPIGFGFHDSIRITGFELMSSLMLHRGFERAGRLFAKEVGPAVAQRWTAQGAAVVANLQRCWDDKAGGYVGGTRSGRQFSVWANGLAYSLADAAHRKTIFATLAAKREQILLLGNTRQIAEPSWIGTGGGGSYQNGGFWATGTGYILPAIWDNDPVWAADLLGEMTAKLPGLDFAEWIDAAGRPNGARGFLASVTLPLLGIRAILENKPLIELF
ncbi:MAG: hypothetical protein HZB16_16020 [Armatimonadetes bacterium]|nr:hypothetical protein [Armatimonadota bacterium]